MCGKKHSEEETSVLEEGHSFGSTYELTDSLALVFVCLVFADDWLSPGVLHCQQ